MTTQRTTAASASALAIVTLALFVGGCGGTNQDACKEAARHSIACSASSGVDLPPEIDLYVALLCTSIPETSECDGWTTFADCVTSIDCTDFTSADPQAMEECNDIMVELMENGCFPSSFGSINPTPSN